MGAGLAGPGARPAARGVRRGWGKREQFERLKAFLTGEDARLPYHRVAADLAMTEGAVRVAVHRMRRRLRELLRDEISQTVAGPEEVGDEIR